ncbi:MAG: methionine--tRNA ligase [Bdellovibrionaceae bacterium]|nr:methionine--tRNA ligase [Pseudobdellovibrionaceae bacterium]|tara:strand:+ start:934 stop:2457 length:1524 start_codon:yes stop_codon:yes gene_type:complete
MKPFYLTTPLYYVNDRPHLGTAYATITADVLKRFQQLFGRETKLLTGTDEHGQKVEQAAKKRNLSPQVHSDEMAENFKTIWKELNISYDIFYRTTDDFHVKAVQKALQDLFDKGDIYQNSYEGWYSVSEEIFYTEKDLVDGRSPEGKEVVKVQETNYFFKMGSYQKALLDHIEAHPDFILPVSRRNEVLGFLRQPLNDLCISRPKERLAWGIPLPFDDDYVTYVWFDALLNYAVAVGFNREGMEDDFKKWWIEGEVKHLIGKDILTTHAVYWSTMLLALGVPLPTQIFATGWILNKDQGKMSKSQGDVMNPLDLKNHFSLDGLRYLMIRDVHMGNDAPFSLETATQRVNADLANNLGNLLSRSTNLVSKFYDGKKPQTGDLENCKHLIALGAELPGKVQNLVDGMKPSFALEEIMSFLSETNKYLEDRAPWKLVKEDEKAAGEVLANALESLRIAATLLSPVMPESMDELLRRIGYGKVDFENAKNWNVIQDGAAVEKGDPLFPRLQ